MEVDAKLDIIPLVQEVAYRLCLRLREGKGAPVKPVTRVSRSTFISKAMSVVAVQVDPHLEQLRSFALFTVPVVLHVLSDFEQLSRLRVDLTDVPDPVDIDYRDEENCRLLINQLIEQNIFNLHLEPVRPAVQQPHHQVHGHRYSSHFAWVVRPVDKYAWPCFH